MKHKWLLVSSVSTALGILAGVVYLFFAEHSLLLSNNSWVLSAFWSTFMLWTFVLMFIVALVFNIMAFIELDDQHSLLGLTLPFRNLLSTSDKRKQFLMEAERFLLLQGKLVHAEHINADYQCLHGKQETLVYIQQKHQAVDISQIRALFQQMLASDITAGIVVSFTGFSGQAWIFAQEANIQLIDAKSLKKQQKRIREQQFALI